MQCFGVKKNVKVDRVIKSNLTIELGAAERQTTAQQMATRSRQCRPQETLSQRVIYKPEQLRLSKHRLFQWSISRSRLASSKISSGISGSRVFRYSRANSSIRFLHQIKEPGRSASSRVANVRPIVQETLIAC